ncbi:hypothetical protein SH661x_002221 [Planctomicrobium sp. SH661]|uniref:hypothetical protein n=1 Tax=Planctomicrobium sp. SH661 TaxID=3448124 RepID=UPI003F5B564D
MNADRNHSNTDSPAAGDLPFLQRVVRYQDGSLSLEEFSKFEKELLTDSKKLQTFADLQLQSAAIHGVMRHEAFEISSSHASSTKRSWRSILLRTFGLATALGLAGVIFTRDIWMPAPVAVGPAAGEVVEFEPQADPRGTVAVLPLEPQVRFSGSSQAKLFGELLPPLRSMLSARHDYVLTHGMVELEFPAGATAIIEAPALFRILADDCLAVDTGRCSVHAPDGAEGFRLETPVTRVVDRGTRFTVKVSEGIDTEVQVVEGIADIYWKADLRTSASHDTPGAGDGTHALPLQTRLEHREAQRFSGVETAAAIPVKFEPKQYRRGLPDRIISYEVTTNPAGHAENLVSVTVQRGGNTITFPVEELIPVELIAFKSREVADRSGHLAGRENFPERRSDWLSDRTLNTGVLNPGGHKEPLDSDPVIQFPEDPLKPNTQGLAVRFQTPVVNGPGPDIVFFELQSFSNPPDGDAFHISPMHFEGQRRSHTIRMYDLTMASPEVYQLASFQLYQFPEPVASMAELNSNDCNRARTQTGFRALAVGIDLTDLGFAENEAVDELFIQDADDDTSYVDPVFIAGFPTPIPETNDSSAPESQGETSSELKVLSP